MAVVERQYAAMPQPTQDVASLQAALKAAIANIEVLCGMRKGVPGLADQLTDLRSNTAGVNARFTEYVEVSANDNGALAQRTTTLEAQYGTLNTGLSNANARITVVDQARADGDGALAQRASTIEANYKDADNYLNGQIVNTNAYIQTVDQARADGDGALASSITTLRADYNGSFAGGSVSFKASSAPSGWNASFTIALVGGLVGGQTVGSGMTILLRSTGSNTYESAISFTANSFMLYDPSQNFIVPVFNYGGGVFTFNVPVVVKGKQLEAYATQRSAYDRQDQASVTVSVSVRAGATVAIFAQWEGRPTEAFANGTNHIMRVIRENINGANGAVLIAKNLSRYVAGNNQNIGVYFIETNINAEDTPPISGEMQTVSYTVTTSTGLGICNIRIQEFFR